MRGNKIIIRKSLYIPKKIFDNFWHSLKSQYNFKGDDGSGLIQNRYSVIGVVSAYHGTCGSSRPDEYTDVSKHAAWISLIVNDGMTPPRTTVMGTPDEP